MDKLTAMRVFVEAVERGSLTAAADRLGLSRAKASRYLAELERWLGIRLLHRSTRSLSLTAGGEQALGECYEMLKIQEKMQSLKGEDSSVPKGSLRITCSSSLSQAYLMKVIADYAIRYPLVNVDMQILERSVNLVDERIDLAIRLTNAPEPGVIARHLGRCYSVVCGSAEYLRQHGHPKTPHALSEHVCLTHSQFSTHFWRFSENANRPDPEAFIKVPVQGRLCANDVSALKQAAIAGIGLAMLPLYQVRNEIDNGQLEIVLADFPLEVINLYAIYTSRQQMTAALRSLLEHLAHCFAADPIWQQLSERS